jgi:hypothetical protein
LQNRTAPAASYGVAGRTFKMRELNLEAIFGREATEGCLRRIRSQDCNCAILGAVYKPFFAVEHPNCEYRNRCSKVTTFGSRSAKSVQSAAVPTMNLGDLARASGFVVFIALLSILLALHTAILSM